MIRAAVALAKYHHRPDGEPQPPPAILVEYWQFRRYGLTPLAGGLRDQPVRWLKDAEILDNVYVSWLSWLQSDKTAKWRKDNPRKWETARKIMEFVDG